jgi:hypothetical protein
MTINEKIDLKQSMMNIHAQAYGRNDLGYASLTA